VRVAAGYYYKGIGYYNRTVSLSVATKREEIGYYP